MYIKMFEEDYDIKGSFFPRQLEVYSQVFNRFDPFGSFNLYYTIDGGDDEKPLLPLVHRIMREQVDCQTFLEKEKSEDVDSLTFTVSEVIFGFQPCSDVFFQEGISYDALLEAVNVEEYMTIHADVICDVYDGNYQDGSEAKKEIAESYLISFGWDGDEVAVFVSLDTEDKSDEFSIG